MRLYQTTKEVLNQIKIAEQEGRLNDHIDDVYCMEYNEIDENFSYHKKWYKRGIYLFLRISIVKPYTFIANHFWLKTKVVGRTNVDGLYGGAILTCNHVNKLDSLAIGYALKGKKIHYTTAEFNNLKCRLGSYMRAYGIMPIPTRTSQMKKFQEELEKKLKKKEWVSFFPESAEWWCYEKPRPYQSGAFHYAAKFNVPIVPLFITFHKTAKVDKQGIEQRQFILHILKPIYPDPLKSIKDNKEMMKKKNEEAIWKCYSEFYL
ncbi:MAG: 1-acyl-sn-glycerol-3-phosphate acyltransferase [Anaeroplasmataceae bacterium]|nr:1-acyl-sn-glycerol-3-phosphate acyltransferase [Anaeroplasmataceae bacterium]